MAKEYDFIVVGQGLAGTCLASELIRLGKRVHVIDSSELPSSSEVAGGLYNPVTGRKMVLTWQALKLFPFLEKFYSRLERLLDTKFLNKTPLYRPFANIEEVNDWQGRATQEMYLPFIEKIFTSEQHPGFTRNPFGGILFRQTGHVSTTKFLAAFRKKLVEEGNLSDEKFNYHELNFIEEKIVYKEYLAHKIILCDGPLGFGNELLSRVRFHALKGEVLQLKIDYNFPYILNRNSFVLATDNAYIAGSNYDLDGKDWETTAKAKNEITEKIDKILNIKYEIIGQRAGLRPTSHDRRPVIGLLPTNDRIGVFNGLGTKGVSLAPYYANQFANFLISGEELDGEVKIDRYF